MFSSPYRAPIIASVIIIVGMGLRLYTFDRYPFAGDADELAFAWTGAHLWSGAGSQSWSTFGPYQEEGLVFYEGVVGASNFSGQVVTRLVSPYFDHPPLFQLLIGALPYLFGYSNFSIYPSALIRLPMLIIALLSFIMLYRTSKLLVSEKQSLLILSFYAFTPTLIFASRIAQPENIFALFFISGIYAFLRYQNNHSKRWLSLIVVISCLSGLLKMTGFFLPPFFALLFARQNQWKEVGAIVLSTILSVITLFSYGYSQQWEIFIRILSQQGGRDVGVSQFLHSLTNPVITNIKFLDGWLLFGLFAALVRLVSKSNPKSNILDYGFWWWVGVMLISAGQKDVLGWYLYPLYIFTPFFSAWLFAKLVHQATFPATLFVFATLLTGISLLQLDFPGPAFRLTTLLVLAIPLLHHVFKLPYFQSITRATLLVILLVGIVINSLLVAKVYSVTCYMKQCPLPARLKSDVNSPHTQTVDQQT